METEDIKPGVKVRRVKHTPRTIHGCPVGFETEIIRLKENEIGFWYEDQYGNHSTTSHPQDWELITDGPVRTVTRREVVPGVWSGVAVEPHEGNTVLVGLDSPGDLVLVSMGPDALKAAAAVLLELAGALEEC